MYAAFVKRAYAAGADGKELVESYLPAFAPKPGTSLRKRLREEVNYRVQIGYTRFWMLPAHLPPARDAVRVAVAIRTSFVRALLLTPRRAEFFDWSVVLETWEEAVERTKHKMNSSHEVWNKYMAIRFGDLDQKLPSADASTALELFEARLQVPHLEWQQTFRPFPVSCLSTNPQTSTRR